jgi:transposase InsO family protein
VSSKYEFIDGEKATYPIVKMCVWIGVSRSGFYEWRDRPASATAERRAALTALIHTVFDDHDGTYGYRRIHAQLGRQGVQAGPELVRAIMRTEGLVACQPRPYRATTTPDAAAAATADLVTRDFTADAPGVKLVGDITYIPTWHGWLYLATVIDCHTKAVVGWSMGVTYARVAGDRRDRYGRRQHHPATGLCVPFGSWVPAWVQGVVATLAW